MRIGNRFSTLPESKISIFYVSKDVLDFGIAVQIIYMIEKF